MITETLQNAFTNLLILHISICDARDARLPGAKAATIGKARHARQKSAQTATVRKRPAYAPGSAVTSVNTHCAHMVRIEAGRSSWES